jgi:hypothetical protein
MGITEAPKAENERWNFFLSHNRHDKPWVRELYRLLVDAGKTVFFDEEDIPDGAPLLREIERGVRGSERILLVLTRTSLASDWVALELMSVVSRDVAARKRRLIPILLEDVDEASIPDAVGVLKMVDLRDRETRDESLRRLLKALEIPGWDAIELPPWPECPLLRVGDIETVRRWGWSPEKLLEVMIALDYRSLHDLDERNEGTVKQWAPIFQNHPQTWRLLYDRAENVVGYWHFAPLFDEDYKRAVEGAMFDSEITEGRIPRFELGEAHCRIYFVQLYLACEFRQLSCQRLLFSSILQVIQQLAQQGVFISDVCANAYSDEGLAHCKTLRLEFTAKHPRGDMYCAPISKVLEGRLAQSFPKLLDLYRDKGLLPDAAPPAGA